MAVILQYIQFPLRILGAVICGAAIGYERENQLKMAGIRTHSLVALASSLMMLISKYGFYDVLGENIDLDPSRIAAGIVTAIGFIGVGVIFNHKMNVSGITTAAGLWATVGVGMALGSGMYVVGIFATVLVLFLQFIFHRNFKWLKSSIVEQITICIDNSENIHQILDNTFEREKIKIQSIKVKRLSGGQIEVKIYVCFPDSYDVYRAVKLLQDNPQITSINV